MGKRGKPAPIAALPLEYWGHEPPIGKAEAEAVIGVAIPDEAWAEIRKAFDVYAAATALVEAPRANFNRNDPVSYEAIRLRAIKAVTRGKCMLDLGLDRDTLTNLARAFSENAELAELSTPADVARYNSHPDAFHRRYDWRVLLRSDPESRAAALAILQAAKARPYRPPSIASAKAALARRIRDICKARGLPTTVTTGREIEGMSDEFLETEPTMNDLLPFERLVAALGVHQAHKIADPYAESPKALSGWLREVTKK